MRLMLQAFVFLFAVVTRMVTPAVSPAAGPREDLLVTSAWLSQHIKDPNLVLLHVGDAAEYKEKHLPGARFVELMDISAPMDHTNLTPALTNLSLELPDAATLRTKLAGFGISDNSTIVVYYGNDWYSPSTRVIFTLQHAGLAAKTKLLDGGMRTWIRDGHQTTTDVPAPKTGNLSPLKIVNNVVDAAFMTANKSTPGIVLVDARDKAFYDGVQPGGQRGGPQVKGHIPGAHSLVFSTLFDDSTGLLLPADRLAALFDQAGIRKDDEVVAYCHVGQQATVVLFAARTLGHKTRLYDGSMNEWVLKGLPVELPKSPASR